MWHHLFYISGKNGISMEDRINALPDNIISGIVPPTGWTLLNDITHFIVSDRNRDAEQLKRTAMQALPQVAQNIEAFIHHVYDKYSINLAEAHLSLDEIAVFHVSFMVIPHEYLSPIMCAVKLAARSFFSGNEVADVRATFMNIVEFARSHAPGHTYSLLYRHDASVITPADRMYRSDLLADSTRHAMYKAPRYF